MSGDKNGELRQWMVAAMGCVLEPGSAVYLSAPITTGPRFVGWRRGPGAGLEWGNPDWAQMRYQAVIAPNREDVVPLVDFLRSRLDDPVIDPTSLEDVPGWEQFDYHHFWTEVIHRYVHTAVFAEGWEYSSGCVLELAAALSAEVKVRTADFNELALEEAVEHVEQALRDVSRDGVLPQEPLETALAALREQQTAGSVSSEVI